MNLGLGYITNATNCLYKDYTELFRIENVDLKENTSIENPVFRLNMQGNISKVSDITRLNYLHWFQSGRYYFIDDIKFLRGKAVEISCRVDVLYSFREDIKESKQFTERCGNKHTNLIPDEHYNVLNNTNIKCTKLADTVFPEGTRHWVLQTATS